MKNSIQVPTENIYEEKSKEFFQSKLAQRLQKKYIPKPFEETYKPIYYIALITSYCCNLFSILTASTFVFSYLLSILIELPYPMVLAMLFTSLILIGIEAIQRFLTPEFFKDTLQFGFNISSFTTLGVIFFLSSLSISFSYSGGFDVVDKLLSPPQYETPILADIENIRTEYKALVSDADNDAEEYKNRKLYMGRLADIHAKVYKELLDKKAILQNAMLAKINQAEAKNETLLNIAKGEYKEALTSHKNSIENKGGGLASFAIIAQLLFFISIFFMEYFDYKTASQYALLTKVSNKIKQVQNNSAKQTTFKANGSPIIKNQIGFKTDAQKQSEIQSKQGKTHIKTIFVSDKKTIEHKGKHYTIDGVNNFINIYQKRVKEANNKGDEKLTTSRKETLNYWLERKEELLTGYIPTGKLDFLLRNNIDKDLT